MGVREWLSDLGVAASSSRLGGVLYDKVCRRIDRVLIPLTGARMAMGPPGQTLLLTTTGAKSGRRRVASLAYLEEGPALVVIASKDPNVSGVTVRQSMTCACKSFRLHAAAWSFDRVTPTPPTSRPFRYASTGPQPHPMSRTRWPG